MSAREPCLFGLSDTSIYGRFVLHLIQCVQSMGFYGVKTTGVHVLNIQNILRLYTEALFL